MQLENINFFLSLVRLGIGHRLIVESGGPIDWVAIKSLADEQGLSAIILDGIDKLESNLTLNLSVQLKLEWIGEVLQNYEQRYKLYVNAIRSLAEWHGENGFKMMVLKGYACSLDWPRPSHRPCGDIDIWQFGHQKEADNALGKEKSIIIDTGHHHHTVFDWNGFTVENHYDFVNIHAHKISKEQEKVFKELGQDGSHFVEVSGEKVYLPSPNLHALFLVRHLANHFASAEITLRQVLDWSFFVEKHGKDVDWNWLNGLLVKYQLREFYDCINSICIEDLGFEEYLFPSVQQDTLLKDRVIREILFPEVPDERPRGVFKRIIWKWHRWKANKWKHKLIYKESRWSAFWSGIWGHLLKPASL